MARETLRQCLHIDRASLADGSLLLSLHPDGSRLAAARGQTVCICPLLPVPATDSGRPASSAEGVHRAPGTQQQQVPQQEEQQQQQQDKQQQQDALHERWRSHAAAGPSGSDSGGVGRGPPLRRFACPAPSCPPATSPDDITALTWLAFARPPPPTTTTAAAAHPEAAARGRSSGGGGGGAGAPASREGQAGRAAMERRRTNSAGGGGGGVFASIQVMMEDHELQRQEQAAAAAAVPPHPHPGYSLVVLLSGTRSGALQLHDADSGAVLLRQQLHPGPVVSISVRTWRMGLNPTEAVEDVTVGWSDAVARLAAWELRAAATTCYAAAVAAKARARGQGAGGSGSGGMGRFGLWGSSSAAAAPAGPDIKPLAFQKWEVPPGAARGRSCAVCCGQRPRDLYSLLQGIGSLSPTATGKTIFLTGGNRPACLAALEVDEQSSGGGGALSYISSVATNVWGLARTARNVAAAPLSIRGGLKYLGLTGGGSGAGPGGGGAAGATGAAAPLASFPDPTAGQRQPATGMWRQFRDDGRVVLSLAPAPHGSLVAAVDNLGRLLLVEVGAMIVSRMWKGYREAQVAWMEVPLRGVQDFLERQRRDRRRGGCEAQDPPQGPGPRQGPRQGPGQGPQQGPGQGQGPQQGPGPGQGPQQGQTRQPAGDECGGAGPVGAGAGMGRPEGPAEAHQQGSEEDGAGPGPSQLEGWQRTHGSRSGGTAGQTAAPELVPPLVPHHGHSAQGVAGGGSGGGDRDPDPGTTDVDGNEYVLLLAVYAPRRQTLELWFPLQGERLAAVAAPPKARLLQRSGGGSGGGELGTWRVADAASAAAPPMSPTGCMMCFAGTAPRLGLDVSLEDGQAEWLGDGVELLDVGSVFGLT